MCSGSRAGSEIDAPGRPVRELVALLEDVARAVDYAHRHKIIHRDLKPLLQLALADPERALAMAEEEQADTAELLVIIEEVRQELKTQFP